MPFKPGQSGNPGGRPKVVGTVREKAQEVSEEGLDGLIEIMRTATRKEWGFKLAAIKELHRLAGLGGAIPEGGTPGTPTDPAPEVTGGEVVQLIRSRANAAKR